MEFSASAMIRFGWETFKKRPWFFIQVIVVYALVTWAINFLVKLFPSDGLLSLAGILVRTGLSILLGMGVTALFLKVHDSVESVTLEELWHPQQFWQYLGTTIIYGLAVIVGFLLLIIPGIIIAITYQFGCYIVIDRNLGPIEALKESARITREHRWELFLLLLLVIGLNILGALALLVGVLVTIPISWIAIVHAYRTLEHGASEVTPVSNV